MFPTLVLRQLISINLSENGQMLFMPTLWMKAISKMAMLGKSCLDQSYNGFLEERLNQTVICSR